MKKLQGLRKSSFSLENKKLANLSTINGGAESNDRWTTDTCGEGSPNQADIKYWRDGKLFKTEELTTVTC